MHDSFERRGRLAGKIAIVFGAGCMGPGWGNGRTIAVRFAQEGATVIAVDRNPDSLSETIDMATEFSGRIEPHICDVGDSAQVARLVAQVLQRHGRINILVNNVGVHIPGGPVALSEEGWRQQIDLNLTSVFTTCKHVLPIMEKQGGGAIVNISSHRPSAGPVPPRSAMRRPRPAWCSLAVWLQWSMPARVCASIPFCRARCIRR